MTKRPTPNKTLRHDKVPDPLTGPLHIQDRTTPGVIPVKIRAGSAEMEINVRPEHMSDFFTLFFIHFADSHALTRSPDIKDRATGRVFPVKIREAGAEVQIDVRSEHMMQFFSDFFFHASLRAKNVGISNA
jgi:hypothetical protein